MQKLTSAKIILFHANQCDPKKCTGFRMARLNRAILIKTLRRIPRKAIVLNPLSKTALSPSDRNAILANGLVALDCSWKLAEEIFQSAQFGLQRALPYLLAANPINTYKPVKLSTAEAVAAALYIIGLKSQAEDVMSIYKWGPSFLALNKAWLDSYAECRDSTEVVAVQNEIMYEHTRQPAKQP